VHVSLSAIILAAGKATRMKSEKVKVLHEICGRPMLSYVFDACRAAGVSRIYVVIGHDRQRVMETYKDATDITWVVQEEQKGTGHAVLVCRDAVTKASQSPSEHVFVLGGDGPLIRAQTLKELVGKHKESGAAVTLATSILPDPTGCGRITRGAAGGLLAIVEQNDATPEQLAIKEVNPTYYLFRTADLFAALEQVKPNNKKGEYYLTDTLAILKGMGKRLEAVAAVPAEDVLSINTRAELADVARVMQRRIQKAVMDSGVTIISPENTWIEFGAQIGQDTVLEPFTWIGGRATIAPGSTIKASSVVVT
jgi:bifunctional UDP-N-acetylglucosamine pyrophosphorylase / glucosamine-1-phosphate N-acetyltransferase